MTDNVLTDYEINKGTITLLAANHFDYDTIVLERDQQIYVKKTPLQLIKAACLEGGSTYEGRRLAVIHQTGARNKVPIPIHPLEQIYAFRAHSPQQHECHWIFYHHISSIKPHSKAASQSIITFKNHHEPLTVAVSQSALQRQMHRMSYCFVRFSHRNHTPVDGDNHLLG